MTASSTSTTAPDDEHTLWVRSDLMADGTYQVGFSYGPDLAWTLRPRAAVDRAIALIDLTTVAEHDAAVWPAPGSAGGPPTPPAQSPTPPRRTSTAASFAGAPTAASAHHPESNSAPELPAQALQCSVRVN